MKHHSPIDLLLSFLLLLAGTLPVPLIAQEWNNVPIGGGGRTVGMIGSPTSDMLYLRTDVAGMYKRSSSDAEWTRLTETFTPDYGERMGGCAGLGVHPTNDNILYAALTQGIYKSTDQGTNWSQVLDVEVLTNGTPGDREDRSYGEALVVDQRNGNVVYYGSHRDGLFYTRNGGDSWTQIPNNQLPHGGSRSVVVDNLRTTEDGRAKFVYVSVRNRGLYRSTDGGTTFGQWQATLPGGGTYVRWLRQSKQGELYAAHDKGLARWDGTVWEDVSPVAGQDVLAVAADPDNNDQVLCFAYERSAKVGNIYRSQDRGDSWQVAPYTANNLPPWADDRYEPGQQITFALYFDDQSEGTNNTAYVMSNYAPWKTTNVWAPTVAWDAFIEGDEMTINITGVSLPPGGAPYIAGMADIRGFKIDDVTTYPDRLRIAQADVNNGFFAPNMTGIDYCESDPNQVWFVAVKRVAASAQDEPTEHIAQVYRSTDGGDNLRYVTNPAAGTEWANDAGGPKIAVSATDADRAVMMARNLVRYTTDGGTTWQNSGSVNRTTGLLERSIEYEFDQLIKSDRVNGNKFYLYATDGRFFKSTDGGASFGLVSNAGLPARTWNQGDNSSAGGGVHLAVAPGREEEVWLALGASGIWKANGSTNKTNAFEEVTFFARDNPTAVAFGRAAPGSSTPAVYVFGKRRSDGQWGVWRSDNLGDSWQLATPPNEPGQWPRLLVGDRQTYGRVYMGNASYGIQYLTGNAAGNTANRPTTSLPAAGQWYYLKNVAHDKHLQGTGAHDGTGNDCSGSATQDIVGVAPDKTGGWTQWKFVEADNGKYYVENKGHRMHLQVYGQPDATANDGHCGDDATKIVRMSDTGCRNEWTQWELREAPGGRYYLYNGQTDTYLQGLGGASTTDMAVRQVPTSCSGSWTQWELVAVGSNTRTEATSKQAIGSKEAQSAAVTVYPNPATGVLQIRVGGADVVKDLTVTDLSGRAFTISPLVTEQGVNLPVDQLSPGVYLLQGTVNQQRFSQRVLIE